MIAKLYILIYIAGHVGATVGPLPYGEEECSRRIAEEYAQIDSTIVTADGFSKKDIRYACEWHAERPKIEK